MGALAHWRGLLPVKQKRSLCWFKSSGAHVCSKGRVEVWMWRWQSSANEGMDVHTFRCPYFHTNQSRGVRQRSDYLPWTQEAGGSNPSAPMKHYRVTSTEYREWTIFAPALVT